MRKVIFMTPNPLLFF